MDILKLVFIGLGFKENCFEYLFRDKFCLIFRLLYYFFWEGSLLDNVVLDEGKVVIILVYIDFCFLIFLVIFKYYGLEVLMLEGMWLFV